MYPNVIPGRMFGSFTHLPTKECEFKTRVARCYNAIIDYMNYYDGTDQELTRRMLIVVDLDPDVTEAIEKSFSLNVTGDWNQLFENYRKRYFSRRPDPDTVSEYKIFMGSILTDNLDMFKTSENRLRGNTLEYCKSHLDLAAESGSFGILRHLMARQGILPTDILNKLKFLTKIIVHENLEILEELLIKLDVKDSGDCYLQDKAAEMDLVHVVDFFCTRGLMTQISLIEVMKKAAQCDSLGVVKYCLDRNISYVVALGQVATSHGVRVLNYILDTYVITDSAITDSILGASGFQGHHEMAKTLLTRISTLNPNTLLMSGSHAGHISCVKLALEHGASNVEHAIDQALKQKRFNLVGFLRHYMATGLIE